MVKRMSDDDVQDYVYNKMFGDLDRIESESMFDKNDDGREEGVADNAQPTSEKSGGVSITIEPLMGATAESGKLSAGDDDIEEEQDKDRKGGLMNLSGMSPIMEQLHGKRKK